MARNKRKVTAAKPQFGNYKSFSQKRTRRQFKPNMQRKRIYVPKLDRYVRVRVSTGEMRTIDKIGFEEFLKRRGLSLKDVT